MSKETSKFLSYVLRHAPETIGLSLDGEGWADVNELLAKANAAGNRIDIDTLRIVVAESDREALHSVRRWKAHPRRAGPLGSGGT